jgi:cell division protein FtsB
MIKKIPPLFKNFYINALVFFLIWMTLFDSNDFFTQYKLSQKRSALLEDRKFYIEKIEEVKQDREELFSNPELLEKFAREKYLMKKPGEDIYMLVEE